MDARDELKSRLSIEDVIGRYLDLKKSGRNFKALSPFTKEKTPSFIVSPEKQIWHDFSSGKGGDVFSFIMEVEGLDFRESLELLAKRAGLDLEQYDRPTKSTLSKNRLYQLLELATKFYQVQLKANAKAYDYVIQKRRFNKATLLNWQIGYSPNTGEALYSFLRGKGYNDQEIAAAGLATKRYSKYSDMFRGRLMIPLSDSQGRVIGFTARLLDDKSDGPKYINTPQTILYDKSRHIFGLHLAKAAIREEGYVAVVEGNLDVIASHQVGQKQVVATAGTALTDQHLKALSLLSKDIRLCFDADKAGLAATERAIPLASKQNLNISIITIPTGKDPDELIQKNPKAWQEALNTPIYALDWLIKYHTSQLDLTSAPGKRRLSDLILPIVKLLSDEVEKDHYLNLLAKLLDVNKTALDQKLEGYKPALPPLKLPIKTAQEMDQAVIDRQKSEHNLLSLLLVEPQTRARLKMLSPAMFLTEPSQKLLTLLLAKPNLNLKNDLAAFKDISDYVKIEVLRYEELYSGLDQNELLEETARLEARLVENYVKSQKQQITSQLKTADSLATRNLLMKAKKLDNLLNQLK